MKIVKYLIVFLYSLTQLWGQVTANDCKDYKLQFPIFSVRGIQGFYTSINKIPVRLTKIGTSSVIPGTQIDLKLQATKGSLKAVSSSTTPILLTQDQYINQNYVDFFFQFDSNDLMKEGDGSFDLESLTCGYKFSNIYLEYDRFPRGSDDIAMIKFEGAKLIVKHKNQPDVQFNVFLNNTKTYPLPFNDKAKSLPEYLYVTLNWRDNSAEETVQVQYVTTNNLNQHNAPFMHVYPKQQAKYILDGRMQSFRIPKTTNIFGTGEPTEVFIIEDIPPLSFDFSLTGGAAQDPLVLCGSNTTINFQNTTPRNFLALNPEDYNKVGIDIIEKEIWKLCRITDENGNKLNTPDCSFFPSAQWQFVNTVSSILTHQPKNFNLSGKPFGTYELTLIYTHNLQAIENRAEPQLSKRLVYLNATTQPLQTYKPNFMLQGVANGEQICIAGDINVLPPNAPTPSNQEFYQVDIPSIGLKANYPLTHIFNLTGANNKTINQYLGNAFNLKTLNNKGISKLTYTIRLNGSSDVGCFISSDAQEIILPQQNFSIDQSCDVSPAGRLISARLTNPINTYDFKWRIGTSGSWTTTAPQNQGVAVNASSTIQLLSSATSGTGLTCTLIDQQTITVKPNPNINFQTPLPTLCVGDNFILTVNNCNNCETVNSYIWSQNNNVVATTTVNNRTFAAPAGGSDITVGVSGKYMNNTCDFNATVGAAATRPDPINTTLMSNYKPAADFDWEQGCLIANNRVPFQVTSALTEKPYQWSFAAGPVNPPTMNSLDAINSKVTYPFGTAGTQSVKLTAFNNEGCSANISKNITIQSNLNSDLKITHDQICAETFLKGSVTWNPMPPTGSVYSWQYREASASTYTTIPGQNSTTLNYKFPSISNEVQAYILQAVVTTPAGCVFRSNEILFLVVPEPKIELKPAEECSPFTYTLPEFSNPLLADKVTTKFFYKQGTATEEQISTPTFTFINDANNTATLNYQLRVEAALHHSDQLTCYYGGTTTIQVKKQPTANFTPSKTLIRPDEELILNGSASSSNLTGVANQPTYQWYVNAIQKATTVNYTFNSVTDRLNLQKHIVTLNVKNNNPANQCEHDIENEITIQNAPPVAKFKVAPNTGCPEEEIMFINESQHAVSYSWNFDDGQNSLVKDPQHAFSANKTVYNVTLTARNEINQEDSFTLAVPIEAPKPGFVVNNALSLRLQKNNPASHTAQIQNTATAKDIKWNFGDGSPMITLNSPTLTHLYNNKGYYTITQEVFSNTGCALKLEEQILVRDYLPISDFKTDADVCLNEEFIVYDASEHAETRTIDFGDGKAPMLFIGNEVTYLYNKIGFYTIKLMVKRINTEEMPAHEKIDEKTMPIEVKALPNANFSLLKSEIKLSHDPQKSEQAQITIASLEGVERLTLDFGDGTIINHAGSDMQTQYKHTYKPTAEMIPSETYTIRLTLHHNNGCSNTSSQQITVLNPALPPVAKFNFSPTKNNCSPVNSTFVNTSEHGSVYNWRIELIEQLGDILTEFNPVSLTTFELAGKSPSYTFTQPGKYKVTLIARSVLDETDEYVDYITIHPDVHPLFVLRTAYPKLAQPVEFINVSRTYNAGGKFYWSFGEGNAKTTQDFEEKSVNYRYRAPGKYLVQLEAINEYGCANSFSDFIEVGSIPDNTSETLIYPNVFRPVPSEGQITTGVALTDEQKALANLVFLPVSMVLAKEFVRYEMSIYNRSGEVIFKTNDLYKGWDGTYKGKILPQNVYIWHVDAELANGTRLRQAGDVLLLR